METRPNICRKGAMSPLFLVNSAIHVLIAIATIASSLRTPPTNEVIVDRDSMDIRQQLTGWLVIAGALVDIAAAISGGGPGSIAG